MATVEQLRAAQRMTQEYAREHGTSGRIGKTGRLSMNIHPVALHNAIKQNGVEVLKDSEYWADQTRRHPEIGVQYVGNGATVGAVGNGPGLRNRFGRIKTRIVFRGGERIEENF